MTLSINLSQQDKKPCVLMFNKEGGFLCFGDFSTQPACRRQCRNDQVFVTSSLPTEGRQDREVSLLRGISPFQSKWTMGRRNDCVPVEMTREQAFNLCAKCLKTGGPRRSYTSRPTVDPCCKPRGK